MRVSSRRERGFTVIETLTAIVIGLIVAVIGFSGTQIFQRQLPLKSSATRLSQALSTGRSFAIAHNAFYQVTLDLDQETFWVDEIQDPSLTGNTVPATVLTPKVIPTEAIHDQVDVDGVLLGANPQAATSGLQYFIFRPDGSADADARVVLFGAGEDPALEANLYTVRLYGPTGVNRVFPRQRI